MNRRKATATAVLVLGVIAAYLLFFSNSPYRFSEWAGESEPSPIPQLVRDGEICPGNETGISCWIEVSNRRGCYVRVSYLQPGHTIRWQGECSDGLGEGAGLWMETGEPRPGRDAFRSKNEGLLGNGRKLGAWVERNNNGYVSRGSYRDGLKHGAWLARRLGGRCGPDSFLRGRQSARSLDTTPCGRNRGRTAL